MAELVALGYAALLGFVAAGILGSFYQLVTQRPPAFVLALDTWWAILSSVVMCAFAGPFIIMRNAVRGRQIEHRPVGWLVLSTMIAVAWSLCAGIVMIETTVSLAT